MKAKKHSQTAISKKTHYIRTFLAALCGAVALALIFSSIVIIWLNQTLMNQSLFTQTLAPLAEQPDIQNFIAAKGAETLINGMPVNELALAVLPDSIRTVKYTSDAALKTELLPVITDKLHDVVKTKQFASLWVKTLASAHAQMISQLNANASIITIDLRPAVHGAIDLLRSSSIHTLGDKLVVSAESGIVSIKGNRLASLRHYYQLLQTARIAVVLAAALAVALCVLLSVHHARTARRILVGTGIIAFVTAGALRTSAYIPLSSDPLERKAAIAIISTLFHNLQLGCVILGCACIVAALISKVHLLK